MSLSIDFSGDTDKVMTKPLFKNTDYSLDEALLSEKFDQFDNN
jgi:hypothetical protein